MANPIDPHKVFSLNSTIVFHLHWCADNEGMTFTNTNEIKNRTRGFIVKFLNHSNPSASLHKFHSIYTRWDTSTNQGESDRSSLGVLNKFYGRFPYIGALTTEA